MLMSLKEIVKKYGLHIKGVLHAGAHFGQEYVDYKKQEIKNIIFFEPVKITFDKLLETIGSDESVICHNIALGNESGEREMWIETVNTGMSSSLLEPGTHLDSYPNIVFPTKEIVKIQRLDDVAFPRINYNMLSMDVQGFELEILKGAKKTLPNINIIYTEINTEDVYKGCAKVEELDAFLSTYGFKRVHTHMACKSWGDALYLK